MWSIFFSPKTWPFSPKFALKKKSPPPISPLPPPFCVLKFSVRVPPDRARFVSRRRHRFSIPSTNFPVEPLNVLGKFSLEGEKQFPNV